MVILTLAIVALMLVFIATPYLARYAMLKGRLDKPSMRKVHTAPTPRIGGHVFIPIIGTTWLFAVPAIDAEVVSLLIAMCILFVMGILDDFKDLSHRIKLPFQLLASGIVIYCWGLVPIDMGGAFGIHVIHNWWGWLLMLLFFQFTINAFNYIDGANGLLGGYTLITFSFLTLWGYYSHLDRIWPLTFLTAASVLGFLFYNLRKTALTFMGDGGSTVIGLLAAIITSRFIQVEPLAEISVGKVTHMIPSFFVFALLFWYPLFDSLQVYTRRLLRGNSLFKADRGHFHHYLLAQTNKNHLLTTGFILAITGILILGFLVSL